METKITTGEVVRKDILAHHLIGMLALDRAKVEWKDIIHVANLK